MSEPKQEGTYRRMLNLNIGRNDDQLFIECNVCRRIIINVDTRVHPIDIPSVVASAVETHSHPQG